MEVTVSQETPLQDDVRDLVAELDAYLAPLTPPDARFGISVDEMANLETTVFVARDENGKAVGMGALKRHGAVGEVKRMYTIPEVRGQRVGRAILDAIVHQARAEGLKGMVLETGNRHPEAWRLYERGGFRRCGPVLDYPDTGHSVFYEMKL